VYSSNFLRGYSGGFGGDYRGILVIIDTKFIINGDHVSIKSRVNKHS
jgi:hypothetical protein